MALQKFANNAEGTLNGAISSGATTFDVQAGEGALFPSLGAGEYCYVRLGSDASNEVVKVTAISTDTFTCVATASGWADNTPVILTASKEMLDEMMQLPGAQSVTGAKTFSDSTLLLAGSSSGAATLKAPAVAGSAVITLPGATGTLATLAGAETLTNKDKRPRIGTLTDSATISVNADDYDQLEVTLGGNRTLGADSGTPYHGKLVLLEVTQDGIGSHTLAYTNASKGWAFTTDVPEPTLSTAAGAKDYLLFRYHSGDDRYICLAVNKGA